MGDDRLPKQAMTKYAIRRKKRKDIPKTTWMNGICEVMAEMGLLKED